MPQSPTVSGQTDFTAFLFSLGTPVMNSDTMGIVDQLYQDRLGTILSVQDLVEEVISALNVCLLRMYQQYVIMFILILLLCLFTCAYCIILCEFMRETMCRNTYYMKLA